MTWTITMVSLTVWMLGLSIGQQTSDIPGSTYLTAAASGLAVIAIAQTVRNISRTEAQKTQVVETLRDQLAEANEEIRELHDMLRKQMDETE